MNSRKKAMISVAAALVVCAICLVGLTYSWYVGVGYSGYGGSYEKQLIVGGSSSEITNYLGTVLNGGKNGIAYTETTTFLIDDMYPGARQYFKTTIRNEYSVPMAYSVYISELTCDLELSNYVSINVTSPISNIMSLTSIPFEVLETGQRRYPTVRLCEKYTVAAGESLDIIWYVGIAEGADNSCIGKSIKIQSIMIGN